MQAAELLESHRSGAERVPDLVRLLPGVPEEELGPVAGEGRGATQLPPVRRGEDDDDHLALAVGHVVLGHRRVGGQAGEQLVVPVVEGGPAVPPGHEEVGVEPSTFV